MAKQKPTQQPRELTALEKLGLRVSAMINSPKAQLERQAMIHRLDSDTDEAWDGVMELLAETDGLEMTFNDDGAVILKWGLPGEGDQLIRGDGELEAVEEPALF